MATTTNTKWMDLVFKILSVIVIPLLGWAVSLQVRLAVMDEKFARLDRDLTEAVAVRAAVNANTLAVGKLEVKIDGVVQGLADLKRIADAPRPPD